MLVRSWIASILLVILTAGPNQPAHAHAVLIETAPEDQARLEAPPAEIRLRFNEPVRAVRIDLADSQGRRATATSIGRGDTVTLTPTGPLARGGWLVRYRVMSADGHPVAGTLGFGVDAPPPDESDLPAPDQTLITILLILARGLHYGGVLVAAGGAVFQILVVPRAIPLRDRSHGQRTGPRRTAAFLAMIGAVAALGLSGTASAGLPVAGLVEAATWQAVGLEPGASVAVLASGLALVVANGAHRGVLAAGAALTLGSLTVTGHAATAPPFWLAVPTVILHGATAAFWIGALAPLTLALRDLPPPTALALVKAFSSLALIAVALLGAAGVGLIWLQSGGNWPTPSPYRTVGLIKLGAVIGLLGLALRNRVRLTPALARAEPGAAARLIAAIRAEAAVAGMIVIATAALGTLPPPRVLLLQKPEAAATPVPLPATGYAALAKFGDTTALIELDPARAGLNTVTVHLAGPDGMPRPALATALELAPQADGGAPLRYQMVGTGPGAFRLEPIDFSAPGRWTVGLEVIWPNREQTRFHASVLINDPASPL